MEFPSGLYSKNKAVLEDIKMEQEVASLLSSELPEWKLNQSCRNVIQYIFIRAVRIVALTGLSDEKNHQSRQIGPPTGLSEWKQHHSFHNFFSKRAVGIEASSSYQNSGSIRAVRNGASITAFRIERMITEVQPAAPTKLSERKYDKKKGSGLSSCRLNQGCQGRSLISELPEQLLLQDIENAGSIRAVITVSLTGQLE
jgi:hypothetical protein